MKNGPISVDTYMKWDRRLGYVGLSRHYSDEAFYEQLATKPRRKQGIAHKFCWQKIIPEALAILRGNKGWGNRADTIRACYALRPYDREVNESLYHSWWIVENGQG